MARHINVTLVDDLDGTTPAVETVQFGLDGQHYEIDVCADNAAALRDLLAPWIAAARKTPPARRPSRPMTAGDDLAAVREWAKSNGMQVASRGRIPASIIAAFHNRGVKTDQERTTAALNKVATVDNPQFLAPPE